MSPSPDRPDGAEPGAAFRVDRFEAVIREIAPSDIDLLHELTIGVFWPHRRRDLAFLAGLGEGYLALDVIGRPMASAMRFAAGDGLTTLGMMVTAPRLQTHGTGRRLLDLLMRDCADRDLRLSATSSGYRLYERAGFVPLREIRQHQGIARPIYLPDLPAGVTIRPRGDGDDGAVRDLDRTAFGAGRPAVLDRLSGMSEGAVAERDGAVTGYALCRPFGRGEVIGPIVAPDEATAMGLAATFLARRTGRFLRVDTPDPSERFGAFLSAAGLGVFSTVTEMYLGRQRRPLEGPRIFGLAMQSLG